MDCGRTCDGNARAWDHRADQRSVCRAECTSNLSEVALQIKLWWGFGVYLQHDVARELACRDILGRLLHCDHKQSPLNAVPGNQGVVGGWGGIYV